MKIRMNNNYGGYPSTTWVGEVIDYKFDVDWMVLFKVIWLGKPGIDEVRADMVETL